MAIPGPGERETDDRRGIQSIEVGFSLIRELTKARGRLPLKHLAASAGMSPSKAHLYLVSFIRLGLVVRDPVTARYGLGPTAIQLGIAAINQLDVTDVARPRMEQVLDATGQSVSLSIWGNRGPTIIARLDGNQPVPISVRVGFVLPLLTTATGRVFLAHLPEAAWRDFAETEEAVTPGRLARALSRVPATHTDGYAITDSETHRGFFGVSAPIFDSDQRICAAITALGLSSLADLRRDGPIATAIRDAARAASAELGGIIGREETVAGHQR